MKKIFILLCLCTILLADDAMVIPKDIALQKAKNAVHKLHSILSSNVKAKYQQEGALSAAKFCAFESYSKIKEINEELGNKVSIKRVSFFNRNPSSFPQKDEVNILKAFDLIERSDAYMPKEIIQMVGYDIYKVYFPATMSSKTCKKCHAEKTMVNPKVQKIFEEKYPYDKAYGFKSGEVRGAVIVTVKIEDNDKNLNKRNENENK